MTTDKSWRDRATVSLTEYAAIIGIGKNTAYAAANEGQIPTINLKRRKLVPVAWIVRQLEGRAA